jgi:hypothetical protein
MHGPRVPTPITLSFLMVDHVHPGLSPQLGTSARILLDLTTLCFQW